MASRTHFLQYYIHLDNRAQFDDAEAGVVATGGWLVGQAPDAVALDYAGVLVIPPEVFDPPCLTSAYFGTGANYPTNVAQFTRKSGGWFGIHLLFGDTHTYKWSGKFQFAGVPPGETEIPGEPTPVAMAERTWVDGFENGASPSGGNASDNYSPLASRHLGGYGFACRNGATQSAVHRHEEGGHALTDRGWERFYVRLRQAPQSSQTFWSTSGTVSPNAGVRLRFTVAGAIEGVNSDASSVLSTVGTSTPLTLNQWYKLDSLYQYGAAPDGFWKVFMGGVQIISVQAGSLPAGTGITQAQNHNGSTIRDGNSTNHRGAWDIDDWIGGELPAGGSNPNLFPSRDWNSGSKVVPLRVTSNGTGHAASWAGPGGANANDFRLVMQRPAISTLIVGITSSAASARAAFVTDAGRRIDLDPMNLGIAGVSVFATSIKTGGAASDMQVGLTLPGGAEVLRTVANEPTVIASSQRGGLLNDGATLEPVSPAVGTEVSYIGNTSASAKTLYNLIAQAECIGNFYLEDYVPQTGDPATITDGFPRHWTNDLHQHPFADGPWAPPDQGAPSILVNHAGTYVGNATSQLLAFRTPPTWILIRNTATHEITFWWVNSPSSRTSCHESTRSSSIPRVYIDPNFAPAAEDDQSQQTIVVIAGNNIAINATGVTYQFMCVQDAGQRFLEAGALWEHAGATIERITTLNNAAFTPEYLWILRELVGQATTRALYVKGLGLSTTALSLVNAAAVATGIEMRTGEVATPAASGLFTTTAIQASFIAFRRDDGSEDVGLPNVMQLASWTGDGTASRTISLGPPTGRRPMWAIVIGSNGVTRIRDASHTGTISTNFASDMADGTTGITGGGIDTISVGSALNTNAILFEAYVIPGCDAVAGNNGWGVNCESIPVEPISPVPPFQPPPTEVPPEPPVVPPPGGTPQIPPTGTVTQCLAPSTLVINMALGRIGSSKQLTAATLNTEVSQEATVCRLHFDEDLRSTLRDFPWQFATRYAVLTQTAGPADEQDTVQAWSADVTYGVNDVVRVADVDYYAIQAGINHAVTDTAFWSLEAPDEVNKDWKYAYRVPSDFIAARRLTDPEGRRRAWDLQPPPFRLGADQTTVDTGLALIYSNEVNVELEYTHLSGCASYEGDALFRSALAWRHGHSIAPSISRDKDKAAMCWAMYQRLLADARTSSVTEQQHEREGDVDWIEGRN